MIEKIPGYLSHLAQESVGIAGYRHEMEFAMQGRHRIGLFLSEASSEFAVPANYRLIKNGNSDFTKNLVAYIEDCGSAILSCGTGIIVGSVTENPLLGAAAGISTKTLLNAVTHISWDLLKEPWMV
ncbi:MAG: hypothetical protein V1808_05015 [Candidatus Daviesbacteria bacterium]